MNGCLFTKKSMPVEPTVEYKLIFFEFLAKKFVNSKKVRTFATLSAGKGA